MNQATPPSLFVPIRRGTMAEAVLLHNTLESF
jgi:hypothetical protein